MPIALHLVEFTDGAPLHADAFTRAGAEAFLRPPLRIAYRPGAELHHPLQGELESPHSTR